MQQNVEIDRPRPPAVGPHTVKLQFDIKAYPEQLVRIEGRLHQRAGVVEPFLVGLAPGRCPVKP